MKFFPKKGNSGTKIRCEVLSSFIGRFVSPAPGPKGYNSKPATAEERRVTKTTTLSTSKGNIIPEYRPCRLWISLDSGDLTTVTIAANHNNKVGYKRSVGDKLHLSPFSYELDVRSRCCNDPICCKRKSM